MYILIGWPHSNSRTFSLLMVNSCWTQRQRGMIDIHIAAVIPWRGIRRPFGSFLNSRNFFTSFLGRPHEYMYTLLKIWNLQLGEVLQSHGINHLVIYFRGWISITNSQHLRSTVLGLPFTISRRSRKSFKKLMKSNMTLRNKIGMSPTRRCEIRQTLMWLGWGRSKCASEAIVLWFVVQPRRLYRFP